MITIEPLSLGAVLHVCQRMRKQDWDEVLNLLPRSAANSDTIAMVVMQVSKIGYVARINGEPVAVIQAAEIIDGTWRFGLFGTNRMPEVALALCGRIFQIIPDMIEDGMRYAEAYADALHLEAHKLLEFLGFKKRAILEGYGSFGADIALYTITRRSADVHGRRWRRISSSGITADEPAGGGGDRGAAGIPQAAG